jgi:hypothetical protein
MEPMRKCSDTEGDGSGFSINRSMLANDVVSASNITEGYNAEPVVWIVGSKGKQF